MGTSSIPTQADRSIEHAPQQASTNASEPGRDPETPDPEGPLGRSDCTDEILVQALAEGATHKAAADRAKVSPRTVRRRVADPDFARKVRAARRQMTDEAAGRATSLLSAAMDEVGNVLRTGEPATRLRAATILLRTADQAALIDDLAQRVEDLEAALAADGEDDVDD